MPLCDVCGTEVRFVWFIEEEYTSKGIKTGRHRRAVSHMECPHCFKNFVVDDTFDGPWYDGRCK